MVKKGQPSLEEEDRDDAEKERKAADAKPPEPSPTEPPATEPPSPDVESAELKRGAGMKSKDGDDKVRDMQARLKQLNAAFPDKYKGENAINLGPFGKEHDGVDGKFGQYTENSVKAFQRANGLKPTGVFDEKTQAALEAEVKKADEQQKGAVKIAATDEVQKLQDRNKQLETQVAQMQERLGQLEPLLAVINADPALRAAVMDRINNPTAAGGGPPGSRPTDQPPASASDATKVQQFTNGNFAFGTEGAAQKLDETGKLVIQKAAENKIDLSKADIDGKNGVSNAEAAAYFLAANAQTASTDGKSEISSIDFSKLDLEKLKNMSPDAVQKAQLIAAQLLSDNKVSGAQAPADDEFVKQMIAALKPPENPGRGK